MTSFILIAFYGLYAYILDRLFNYYKQPKDFGYDWKNDDGSDFIRTSKVVHKQRRRRDKELVDLVKASRRIKKIKNAYSEMINV